MACLIRELAAAVMMAAFVLLSAVGEARADEGPVDLTARYPTTLDQGDLDLNRARAWTFTADDIYALTGFQFRVGDALTIDIGAAYLGIGHGDDGAVWALVIPRDEATAARLTSAKNGEETVASVWLRFHPREIATLFPPATVRTAAWPSPPPPAAASGPATTQGSVGGDDIPARMQRIAAVKFHGSFHAGNRALIPERHQMTVDVDVRSGWRRFFVVDTAAGTAEYHTGFAKQAVKDPEPLTDASLAAQSFDLLWETFDQRYAMFGLRPEVDWNALREQYRPKALAARDQDEFARVCAEMLRPLRDLHVWVRVGERFVEVFNRPRTANANPAAYEALLGDMRPGGSGLRWARTKDAIGFVMIPGWSNGIIPRDFDAVLEEMRNTRGLIVDVRLNGGGSEPLAQQVAGRFADREIVYAYHQVREGPKHTDLSERQTRSFGPRGPWRYDRPVILLIGQKCMSSNESFVAMMGECPQVTTMGDRTCGSSGNPMMLDLPVGVTVSVPQWIDLLPDGNPLDERGVQPDVRFEPLPGAFEGTRDDLLAAALERLRQVPLPEKPIEGPAAASPGTPGVPGAAPPIEKLPARWAEDPNRPHVVEVAPAADAADVAPRAELRIRFDRPMDLRRLALDWRVGTYLSCGEVRYEAAENTFVIPVELEPNTLHRIAVNYVVGDQEPQGFKSREGVSAAPFIWQFRTSGPSAPADAQPPKPLLIDPPSGAEVAVVTRIRVQFDEAMDPGAYRLAVAPSPKGADSERPEVVPVVEYDAPQRQFTFVVLLPPARPHRLELRGLRSARGGAAKPIVLEYTTGDALLAAGQRAELEQAARAPELQAVLQGVQTMRRELQSLSETVTEVISVAGPAGFAQLRSYWAVFKWQAPRQFFGDVTPYMTSANRFCLGSDGERCWWHLDGPGGPKLVVGPFDAIAEKNVSLCSPFGDLDGDLVQAAAERCLEYRGLATVSERRCHRVRGWYARVRTSGRHVFSECRITDWYVDAETFRPLRVVVAAAPGCRAVLNFAYDRVNGPIPPAEFSPPVVEGLPPTGLEPLQEGCDRHFLTLRDGAGGNVGLRWGQRGAKKVMSSGLN